jgi:hypothetical protein
MSNSDVHLLLERDDDRRLFLSRSVFLYSPRYKGCVGFEALVGC